MDQQNAELEKRLEKLEQEFSELRKRLDDLTSREEIQAVPKNEKKPKGKLFLRVCIPILILCLLAGGFFYYRTSQKPSYAKAEIGDIVTFGRYEQNNSAADGPEPIEWIVLDKQDGKILLLSRYILFKDGSAARDWFHNPIRSQLNSDFFSISFTPSEQERICTVSIQEQIRTSTDKIFLLSEEEAEKYFSEDESRKCVSTYSAGGSRSRWWLRTISQTERYNLQVTLQAIVSESGEIITCANSKVSFGVRPALWLDIT